MIKFFYTFFVVVLTVLMAAIIFIFAASYPVPEGTDEIIKEVYSKELPNQIKGDTGKAKSKGIDIWYESIQPTVESKGTILLIMGLGGNALEWPLYFTMPLVEEGFRVIRFDNRSSGLSTWPDNDFTIQDMTEDAVAVMDALGVKKAHILGMSMGGMIGQIMAIEHPDRVQSLISFMSSGNIDDPDLPSVSQSTYASIVATAIRYGFPRSEKSIIKSTVGVRSFLSYDLSEKRIKTLIEQTLFNLRYRKGFNPRAFIQHTKAVRNSGSRYIGLQKLKIPVLVIHGREDPLIPVEHAIKTALTIPEAELLILEGMGHDTSPEHTPLMHEAILKFIEE
jgi:pimeloyl-ACP methyl ester carboxylesterase